MRVCLVLPALQKEVLVHVISCLLGDAVPELRKDILDSVLVVVLRDLDAHEDPPKIVSVVAIVEEADVPRYVETREEPLQSARRLGKLEPEEALVLRVRPTAGEVPGVNLRELVLGEVGTLVVFGVEDVEDVLEVVGASLEGLEGHEDVRFHALAVSVAEFSYVSGREDRVPRAKAESGERGVV